MQQLNLFLSIVLENIWYNIVGLSNLNTNIVNKIILLKNDKFYLIGLNVSIVQKSYQVIEISYKLIKYIYIYIWQ